jgi:hypothetical protein
MSSEKEQFAEKMGAARIQMLFELPSAYQHP